MSRKIAVVLKGYPRLSETFIAQELRGLEQAGLELTLVALRRPTDAKRHPVHDEVAAPVSYLPEYLTDEPRRVIGAFFRSLGRPGFWGALSAFLRDYARDRTRNRIRRFGQALVLAAEWPPGATWLHAHFIHTPASVTSYASLMLGIPWTCSAHAKDIWTSPDWELSSKLAQARWTVTCTRTGYEHLQRLSVDPSRVHLSYHGLDLDRFAPFDGADHHSYPQPYPQHRHPGESRDPSLPREDFLKLRESSSGALGPGFRRDDDVLSVKQPQPSRPPRDGSDPADPVTILSVGRAVEKKGYDVLLRALALLPRGLAWRFVHVGGGGELERLASTARSLGLEDRVEWKGAMVQEDVLALYRRADLFALACRVAADGDRDGLPNVLVEAASQGLACISTQVSGVPELLTSGETGFLVPPDDPATLAAALARAIADPALRFRIGQAAEHRVRTQFDHRASIAQLKALFEAAWREAA